MRWIVAASGPSLTQDVAAQCQAAQASGAFKLAAVNDAYILFPAADLMYACDSAWWKLHNGCPEFKGKKFSSQMHPDNAHRLRDEKREIAKRYNIELILGRHKDGFCFEPGIIHYGSNSGFQCINLVLHKGGTELVLVGFDMRTVNGKRHFFGNHRGLNNSANFESWVPNFNKAAAELPPGIKIVNATPGSAIRCFPMMSLGQAIGAVENA